MAVLVFLSWPKNENEISLNHKKKKSKECCVFHFLKNFYCGKNFEMAERRKGETIPFHSFGLCNKNPFSIIIFIDGNWKWYSYDNTYNFIQLQAAGGIIEWSNINTSRREDDLHLFIREMFCAIEHTLAACVEVPKCWLERSNWFDIRIIPWLFFLCK